MTNNKATLERHLRAEAERDATGAAATYRADGFYCNHAFDLRFDGRSAVELQYAASYETIRGMAATYLFELVDGDRVLQCGRIRGRAAETVLGVPTAQGQLDFPFLAMIIFGDGEMLGEHIVYDLEQFCQQAGADVSAVRAAAAELAASLAPATP